MTATLTVQLDAGILKLAEEEARAHRTSLTEVLERQLRIMAENRQESQRGRTPLTDELRGTVNLVEGAGYRDAITEELRKKYGV